MDLLNLPDQDASLSFVYLCNITGESKLCHFYYVYDDVSSNFLALSSEKLHPQECKHVYPYYIFIIFWGCVKGGGGGDPPIFLVNII